MKTANNPFLATIQNKTSAASNIDNRYNNSNNNNIISVKSNTNTNTNDKGNKKLRRQTISDPNAYIRYIHSLLGDKCITKPCASTLAKSTTTATNDDKSQKQCQQQQLQQIGLQFQGITLYDDDVAKSQNNNNNIFINNGSGNNKWKIGNRNNDYDKRKALENQQNSIFTIISKTQQQEQEQQIVQKDSELSLREAKMNIEGKLAEQIRIYNSQNNINTNNNNNISNHNKNNNRDLWMGTYPTTRVKRTPISLLAIPTTTTTITYTTTTNLTRMTTKIAPTTTTTTITPVLIEEKEENEDVDVDFEGTTARPIKSALRKHHSFNMQPTYIMHKQMYLQQQQQQQSQSIACIAKQTTTTTTNEEKDVNEIEQQLMTSRYHATFGGPLVFRPLTLNEKHNFKPIARPPDGMSIECETKLQVEKQQQKQQQQHEMDQSKYESLLTKETCDVVECKKQQQQEQEHIVEQEQSSEEEFLKEIKEFNASLSTKKSSSSSSTSSSATITPTPTNSPTLHPAASLEVLEALTQSNPELIYAATQPGSRLNLHTQLSALNETHYGSIHMSAGQTQLRAKLHAALCENDNIEHNAQKYQTALRRRNVYFGNNDISSSNVPATADEGAAKPEDDADADAEADFCFYEIPINEENTNVVVTTNVNANVSPNATIILNDGQVKYLIQQNLHEIHI